MLGEAPDDYVPALIPHCLQRPASVFVCRLSLPHPPGLVDIQVTFGDSGGRLESGIGALALGWDVVPAHSRGGNGSALSGSNAVVCEAGAGRLPATRAAASDSCQPKEANASAGSRLPEEGKPKVPVRPTDSARLEIVGTAIMHGTRRARPYVAGCVCTISRRPGLSIFPSTNP